MGVKVTPHDLEVFYAHVDDLCEEIFDASRPVVEVKEVIEGESLGS